MCILFADIVKLVSQRDASESASSSSMETATSSNGTWPSAGADTFRTSSRPSWTHSGAGRCSCSRSPSSFHGYCSLSSGGSSSSLTGTSLHHLPTKTKPSPLVSTTSTPSPAAFSSPSKPNTLSAMAQEQPTRNALKRSLLCAYKVLSECSFRLSW